MRYSKQKSRKIRNKTSQKSKHTYKSKQQTTKNKRKNVGWIITIIVGVSSALLISFFEIFRDHITSPNYSYTILSVKDHYGRLTSNDKSEANYIFIKILFKKPFYSSNVEIMPEKLIVYDYDKNFKDEYIIVTNMNCNNTYLPQIQTEPKIIESTSSVDSTKPIMIKYLCEDMVFKGYGKEPQVAESFEDIRQDMLKVPFILKRDDQLKKVFIFKMEKGKSDNYTSRSPNYFYQILGKNLKIDPHRFMTFFSFAFFDPYKSTHPATFDFAIGKFHYHRLNYKKALKQFNNAIKKDSNYYIAQIYKGICMAYLGNHVSGSEIIKSNIKLINKNQAIDVLLDILTVHRNAIKDRKQTKYFIDYGFQLYPNSLFFQNFQALHLIEELEFTKALNIYESITQRIIINDYHYRLLINKGFLLHLMKEHKLSNYYILKYLTSVVKENPVKKDLLESMYACLTLNYHVLGNKYESSKYFHKIENAKYRIPVEKIMNNAKAIMTFRFCYY